MRQYNSPDGATAVTCFNVELTAIFGMVSRRAGLSATAGHSCQDYRPRGLGVGRFPIDAIDFKDHGRSLGSRSSTDHRRVSVDVSCFYLTSFLRHSDILESRLFHISVVNVT